MRLMLVLLSQMKFQPVCRPLSILPVPRMPALSHGVLETEEPPVMSIPFTLLTEAGSFNVVLTVRDVAGASDEMSITVIVMAPEFIEHSGNITSDETWIEGVHFITRRCACGRSHSDH